MLQQKQIKTRITRKSEGGSEDTCCTTKKSCINKCILYYNFFFGKPVTLWTLWRSAVNCTNPKRWDPNSHHQLHTDFYFSIKRHTYSFCSLRNAIPRLCTYLDQISRAESRIFWYEGIIYEQYQSVRSLQKICYFLRFK